MSGTRPDDPIRDADHEDLSETEDLAVTDDDVTETVRGGGIDGEAQDKHHGGWDHLR
jgi:hypothetical protein